MTPAGMRYFGGDDRNPGSLKARVGKVRRRNVDDGGLRQGRPHRGRADQLEMRMILAVRIFALEESGHRLRGERVRCAVFGDVLMCKAVDHLGNEKAKAQQERGKVPGNPGATQAAHDDQDNTGRALGHRASITPGPHPIGLRRTRTPARRTARRLLLPRCKRRPCSPTSTESTQ